MKNHVVRRVALNQTEEVIGIDGACLNQAGMQQIVDRVARLDRQSGWNMEFVERQTCLPG